MKKPIVIVCEVPGEEPRVVIKFDDYQEAVNHVAILNQETNTNPYRIFLIDVDRRSRKHDQTQE